MNISLKWATDETEERKLRERLEKELEKEEQELMYFALKCGVAY